MANDHNLIPLNKRSKEDAKRIAILGGKASGGIRYDQKTCYRCRLPCKLRETRGKKKGQKCIIPDAQRFILEARNDPNKLLDACMVMLTNLEETAMTHKEKNDTVNSAIKIKNAFFPERQKVDVNVKQLSHDDFANALEIEVKVVEAKVIKKEEDDQV